MSTVLPTPVRCALCGTTSTQYEAGSSSSFGSADLDLRPAPTERGLLFTLVQRCPSCGYCNDTIEEPVDGAAAVIESDEYRALLGGADADDLAGSFLCLALIREHQREFGQAAIAALQAAWANDDDAEQDPDSRLVDPEMRRTDEELAAARAAAVAARERAIELIDHAHAAEQTMTDDVALDRVVRADLLRRAGRFIEASEAARLAKRDSDELDEIMLFEISTLCSARDAEAATIREAHEAYYGLGPGRYRRQPGQAGDGDV